MKFTYRSGQTPLEGYTIKRGVGQGGFGEVYFALSDGGKEVALKLLLGQSDVELRGVANCLNMKHPNLVHVYDLKEDARGDKWLVMEYVLGESLSAVLHRHPHGLPLNMVGEWFSALAKAVAYLHDRGVVHRDLKPANIFIEAGTLKVGDYGLCKSISVSQRQTKTVGTVHYMAPEVSTGNYSQKIDIYACGILLHEMLTGRIPFDGESDAEILMKHLTATPDLSHAPEAFRPVLAKALEKNPNQRYASMAEMAKAVDEAIQQTHLPVAHAASAHKAIPVATRLATPVPPSATPPPLPAAKPVAAPPRPKAKPDDSALPLVRAQTWRDRLVSHLGALLAAPLVALVGLVPYALVVHGLAHPDWPHLGRMFFVTTALAWAVLLGSGTASAASDGWWRRLGLGALGLGVGGLAFWLDGHTLARPVSGEWNPALLTVLYFGAVLAAGRWWRAVARDRTERFSLFPVLAAGFWASVLLALKLFGPAWGGFSPADGIVPVVLAVIAAQAVSPWTPAPQPTPGVKKLRLGRT